ncbi:CIA30 family protein [Thalassotalea marina]|uniref:NADH:ubiquinone oxidoreductase intermediate-associated protein 30 domain-containing protein n=1 Tax=Thalassotalea marina TaxID=1673741 RepID=A0A919BFM3_9GAMM|nr:CIA30 family protein [Thalassotalea marina]GHF85450.1 hypothetical protein GCM10017161_11260 [Thalassotalea marina]
MKFIKTISKRVVYITSMLACISVSSIAFASILPTVVDDFSHATNNSLGIPRLYIDDSSAGGKTKTEHTFQQGSLNITGKITPARGQPGWSSTVLPLSIDNSMQDASKFTGIKLKVKLRKGMLSVSANSSEVTNFDFHAAPIVIKPDNTFHEITIPFNTMKRAWSEQTKLNTSTLISISIVAFGLQPSDFDFDIANVSFY